MANTKSLKPFKRGFDPRRNVKGRVRNLTNDHYLSLLENYMVTVNGERMPATEALVFAVVEQAMVKTNPSLLSYLIDRIYGKPKTYCHKRDQRITKMNEMVKEEEGDEPGNIVKKFLATHVLKGAGEK